MAYNISCHVINIPNGDHDGSHIVYGYRQVKIQESTSRFLTKVQADAGEDQSQEHDGIDGMPQTDPVGIKINFLDGHDFAVFEVLKRKNRCMKITRHVNPNINKLSLFSNG
jgi:hypothetical protein